MTYACSSLRRAALVLRNPPLRGPSRKQAMATVHDAKPYLSHEERTAAAARDPNLHQVIVSQIKQVNRSIRLLQLKPENASETIKFLPGQWLDVHVPGISKAGGFTITSTPAKAQSATRERHGNEQPYLELAIQYSPKNPPAAYLWRPEQEILGSPLVIRVGGNFVWPPLNLPPAARQRVLLIAGGVGINPLISILAHLHDTEVPLQSVKILYGTKSATADGSDVLFLSRIKQMLQNKSPSFGEIVAELYVTSASGQHESASKIAQQAGLSRYPRRMKKGDLERALSEEIEARRSTVCYICGPQAMTDEFVATVKGLTGVPPENVLCEKWW